jgi:hypothetical protein
MYRDDSPDEIANVREYLIRLSEAGTIVVPLSFFVLFELLQDCTPEFEEDRLNRARFIRRLCGENAFPYTDSLLAGKGLSKDGSWFPLSGLEQYSIQRMESYVVEALSTTDRLDRRTRRRLSNRKEFRKLLRARPDLFDLAQVDLNFSMPQEFIRGISCGAISWRR